MSYQDYLQSEHWKKLSAETKRLAGNRCQVCNGKKRLEAHHRTYERIGFELPGDLIVLCYKCHGIFHHEDRQAPDFPLPPVVIYHGKSDSAWGNE